MGDLIRFGIEFEVEPDAELRSAGFTSPFRDTLWLSEDDLGGEVTTKLLTDIKSGLNQNVNVLKAQRFDAWRDGVLHPAPAAEPEPVDPGEAARAAVEAARSALDAATEALASAERPAETS